MMGRLALRQLHSVGACRRGAGAEDGQEEEAGGEGEEGAGDEEGSNLYTCEKHTVDPGVVTMPQAGPCISINNCLSDELHHVP